MKILFSGGGTLGPVTPLLAIFEIKKKEDPNTEFLWVGTKTGPEKGLVEEYGIPFLSIGAGKWRRYFSILNILDIFKIIFAFFQSLLLLKKQKPDVVISAGGFVSVPIHLAAFVLRIPSWVHQQDIRKGLANKLMVPFAKVITTATKKSLEDFSKKKTIWLGNPIREDILKGSKESGRKIFNLKENLPVVLATGGGTGSLKINQMVVEAVEHLKGTCQILHLTGKERSDELARGALKLFDHYQIHSFLGKEMKDAYAISDIVVSRGGFGTISEIAALGKVAILVPMPGQQTENTKFLKDEGAAIVLNENLDNGVKLGNEIKGLLEDPSKMEAYRSRLKSILPYAEPKKVLEVLKSF